MGNIRWVVKFDGDAYTVRLTQGGQSLAGTWGETYSAPTRKAANIAGAMFHAQYFASMANATKGVSS